MSDRTSAGMFSTMFELLASDPTPQHISWAYKLWQYTSNFDFSSYQLYCDDALVRLKLARVRKDPEEPEDGEVMFYGPEGKDSR
jgi:hypothetical protein